MINGIVVNLGFKITSCEGEEGKNYIKNMQV